jgi:hypothetical protein
VTILSINPPSTISIFFDESGKKETPIQLMGLSIPSDIYYHETMQEMHDLNESYSFHWSKYNGDSKMQNGIIKLFEKASILAQYSKMIILYYSYNLIEQDAKRFSNPAEKLAEQTIYSKFPERIMYGLLRHYGKSSRLTADIYIEHANEYENLKLAENVRKQLNSQAIYRGEPYAVTNCSYRAKGEEIEVEMTDLLLGIARTIMENKEASTRGKREQHPLILRLIKMELLAPFYEKCSFYEWTGQTKLSERDFNAYVNLFVSKNFDQYQSIHI